MMTQLTTGYQPNQQSVEAEIARFRELSHLCFMKKSLELKSLK